MLIHLDPDYLALMADISAQLKVVFGTINELTLPVSGIGSAGMEACLASLPAPGEKAIVRPDSRTGDCTP